MTDAEIARRALPLLDLTDLSDDASEVATDALVAKARMHPVAALCLWPRFVAHARRGLDGTGIALATVVNFARGDEPAEAVAAATLRALGDGADEIDVVMPYRAWLAGDVEGPRALLSAVREAAGGALLKVILEAGALPSPQAVAEASVLAIRCGADFIKTSTGKIAVGATPEAARAMLEAIRSSGRTVGLKVSGGVRTVADARTYLDLADAAMGPGWASPATLRIGASGLHDALAAALRDEARA